jgi:head-tail adaptor
VRAGLLDRKVTIQTTDNDPAAASLDLSFASGAYAVQQDQDPDFGSVIEQWRTFAIAWCRFEERGGIESERANREFTARNATVTMRFIDGLHAGMRLLEPDGSIWQINSVSMKKRRASVELDVVEYARG